MKRCSAWKQCPEPIMWVWSNGGVFCTTHKKIYSTPKYSGQVRRLSVAERRLVNAGFHVSYKRKISKVEAVTILILGKLS